jgi:hypothetical protein
MKGLRIEVEERRSGGLYIYSGPDGMAFPSLVKMLVLENNAN